MCPAILCPQVEHNFDSDPFLRIIYVTYVVIWYINTSYIVLRVPNRINVIFDSK